MNNNPLSQLDPVLETYLVKKAPALPANIKEVIVKFGPYLSALVLLLSLPALIGLLGLSAILAPTAMMYGYRPTFQFWGLLYLIPIVLEILALPGLFKRKIQGWNFLYYATLVNALLSLLRFDLFGLIIGTLLSLYILFQVKSYYK